MSRPADENLPEVVQNHPPLNHPAAVYQQQPYPEVVPDSSPEAYTGAPPYYAQQQEKYPAYYDNAPKLPHDPYSPVSHTSHPVPGMQQVPVSPYHPPPSSAGDPVSAFSPNSSVPWQRLDSSMGPDDQRTFVNSEPEQEKRIFGLRRKIFFIIVGVLAVVIIAAAVGGGVGAAMNSGADDDDDSGSSEAAETGPVTSDPAAESSTATNTPTLTTTSTTSSSTPSATNVILTEDMVDSQEFAFQAFSGQNYTGERTPIYTIEGRYDFGFDAQSYLWFSKKWSCCHTYCVDEKTAIGYHCDRRPRNETDEPFPRISIWCGNRVSASEDGTWRDMCAPSSTTTEIERRSLFSRWLFPS